MALRSKAEIVRRRNDLRERCELEASLYGPKKRIRGRSESAAKSRFAASVATGFAANVLDWVLREDEKDARRREKEGDYE